MYLRFVVADVDEDSHMRLGIFQAIAKLEDHGKLCPHEKSESDFIEKWFEENLLEPTRFTTSKPPYYRKQNTAISWFKDGADEHIRHVRSLAAILENHGVSVEMLTTDRVGYVVYEDEFQIVAEPFTGERD